MLRKNDQRTKPRPLDDWFRGKPAQTRKVFDHFVREFKRIGTVTVRSAKNMIILTTSRKGIAYVVIRKSWIDAVLPFRKPYKDTLCFHKVAQAPAGSAQFNHYLRIFNKKEDVNSEVKVFMKLAYAEGS